MNHGMSKRESWILAHDPVFKNWHAQRFQEARNDMDQLNATHLTDGKRHAVVLEDPYGSLESFEDSTEVYQGLPIKRVSPEEFDSYRNVARTEGWL